MLSTEFIPSSDDDDSLVNTTSSSSASTASTSRTFNFSTNPEATKFVPPPKVQFFYSLQVKQPCNTNIPLCFAFLLEEPFINSIGHFIVAE